MQEKELSEDNVKDLSADLQVRMLLTFFTSRGNNFPADTTSMWQCPFTNIKSLS
jgi:hypothetical protein